VNPEAMLSRGVAGFINQTLVINLPGSPDGVRASFAVLTPMLSQALQMLRPTD
jgi:molybdopterin biosynthesis enzyme MoaB